jgi:hypothetical protein
MSQQIINIGTSAGAGDGDELRLAFDKVNENFTEIYSGNVVAGNLLVTSVAGRIGNVELTWLDVAGVANTGNITQLKQYISSNLAAAYAYTDTAINNLSSVNNITVAGGTLSNIQIVGNSYGTMANLAVSGALSANSFVVGSGGLSIPNGNFVLANGSLVADTIVFGDATTMSTAPNFAPTNTAIAGLRANITAANAAIVAGYSRVDAANSSITTATNRISVLEANATTQAQSIISLTTANSIQAGQISTLAANAGSQHGQLVALRANVEAANVQISSNYATLTSNASTQQTQINVLQGNVVSLTAAVASINAGNGLTSANTEIDKLRANITAANVVLSALSASTTANASTQAQAIADLQGVNSTQTSQIVQLQANIAAANAVIAAVDLASVGIQISGLRANITAANTAIGAVTTAWTANAATQAGVLATLTSNAASQSVALTSLVANDAVQHNSIVGLRANIAAANAAIAAIPNINSLPGANITGQVANSVVSGTVYNPLQPNITQVGTLTALTVDGNAQIDSLTASAFFGPVRTPTQPFITAIGTLATLTVTSNVSAGNVSATKGTFTSIEGAVTTASQPNITSIGTLATLNVTGNVTSANVVTGNVVATRVTAGNLVGTIATSVQTNITRIGTLPNLAVTGNVVAGNLVTTGTVTAPGLSGPILTASQPTITEIGTLGNLVVTGDITVGNIQTTANIAFGNLYAGHVTTPILSASDIRGPLTTATQTNITRVGTLTNLAVAGDTTIGGNATISGTLNVGDVVANVQAFSLSVTANLLASNVNASFLRSSGNIVASNFNLTGNIFSTGTDSFVHATTGDFSTVYGTLATNAQPNINSVGTLDSLTVNGPVNITGSQFVAQDFYVTGNLFVNGNTTTVSAGNVTTTDKDLTLANGAVNSTAARGAGIYIGTGGAYGNISVYDGTWLTAQNVTVGGNLIAGNVSTTKGTFTSIEGTITTASQTNITAIGTLGNLAVTGNVSGTLTTSDQPFITNIGTLGNITISGTARVGSLELLGGAGSTLAIDNLNLSANATVSNINVSGTANLGRISGTLITNAQPNITSIGTLASLTVTGAVTTANITANGATIRDLNVTNANLGIANFSGNITTGNVSGATGTFTNVSASFVSVTGNVNTAAVNATNGTFVEVQGRILTNAQPYITSIGNLATLDIAGNLTTGNVSGATGTFTNVRGTILDASQTNITAIGTLATLSVTGNVGTGNVSGETGTFTNVRGTILDASQTNITAIGNLATLNVAGNVTTGNVSGATGTFTNVRGLLLDPAQTNITSVGTLSGLSVTGNIAANIIATLIYDAVLTNPIQPNITTIGTLGVLSVTGNVGTGNVSGETGTFTNVRGTILDASQTNITTIGTLTSLTVTGATTAANISANGLTAKDINVTSANIGANANIVGNVTSANISGFKGTFTQVEGTLLTNAQPFITSIGTLPSLVVTGNIGADNLNANTSNITGNSVTLNDLVTGTTDTNNLTVRGTNTFLSNITASTSLNVANLLTVAGANINAFGANIQSSSAVITNVTIGTLSVTNTEDAISSVSGAIITPGGISASKQIYSGGNVIADGNIVTAGNVIAGTNVRVGGDMYFFGAQPSLDFITDRSLVSLFDSSATTISVGGEATTVNIGAISGFGNTTIRNDLTLKGGLFPEGGFGEVGIGNVVVNNDLSAAGSIYANDGISATYIQIGARTITGNGFSNARTTATNINSGALQVRGGAGISGNLVVGAPTNTNSAVYINSISSTINSSTGALQVAGGIATKGNLWVDGEATIVGNVNFTAFVAASVNGTPIGNASPNTGVFTSLAFANSTPGIRPTINYDFANSPILPPSLNYSRTGPATYTDQRGNLRVAPAYTPRFTYDPDGVCLGIMIEESRQNLYRESNSFANTAVYATTNATISTVANATTSPDGAYNAFKLVDDATLNIHGIAQQSPYSPTVTLGSVYTASAFVKAAEKDQVALIFQGENDPTIFDLTLGTVDDEGPTHRSTIELQANGWYRISSTVTKTNTDGKVTLALADGGGFTYTGTGSTGAYVYGFQLEPGAFATSYIPNTTTANTRGVDTLTVVSSEFNRKYVQGASTVFVDARLNYRPTTAVVNNQRSTLISINDGTEANRVSIVAENKTTPNGYRSANLVIYSGGALTTNVAINSNITVSGANLTASSLRGHTSVNSTGKVAVYFTRNGLIGRAYNNVGNVYASLGTVSQAMTQIQIGAGPGTSPLNGTISKLQIYPAIVNGNELQTLTRIQAEGAD